MKDNFSNNNTGKLIRLIAGITLSSLALLPLSGCLEPPVYRRAPSHNQYHSTEKQKPRHRGIRHNPRTSRPKPNRSNPCLPESYRRPGARRDAYYKYHPDNR